MRRPDHEPNQGHGGPQHTYQKAWATNGERERTNTKREPKMPRTAWGEVNKTHNSPATPRHANVLEPLKKKEPGGKKMGQDDG